METARKNPQTPARTVAFLVLLAGLLVLPFLSFAPTALATNTPTNAATNGSGAPAPRRTSLTNPLGSGVTIQTLVGRATRGLMGLSGSFALLMFVYGSFVWVTSGGNMDKVKKGKQIFTWATIGLIVIFGSYAFLATFINAFGG